MNTCVGNYDRFCAPVSFSPPALLFLMIGSQSLLCLTQFSPLRFLPLLLLFHSCCVRAFLVHAMERRRCEPFAKKRYDRKIWSRAFVMVMFPDKEGGRPHGSGRFQRKRCYGSFLSLVALFLSSENENREGIIHAIKMRARRTGQFRPISSLLRERKRQGKERGVFLPPPIFSSEWSHLGPICRSRLETEPRRYEKEENGNGWWFHLS